MERKGYWLKPGARPTAPGVLFAVVPAPAITGSEAQEWHSWGGAAVVMSSCRAGAWRPYKAQWHDSQAGLHDWIEAHAHPHRRNYVITPAGSETAAQVGLWDHIDRGAVKYLPVHAIRAAKGSVHKGNYSTIIRRVAVSPRCFILDYERSRRRLIWLSGRQFFDAPESALATAAGCGWVDSAEPDRPGVTIGRTPHERAVVWLSIFQHLADWWLTHAKAPFGLTGSALSMGMLRTHVAPKSLCTHSQADTHQLERDACFGGRAQTWFYGVVGRPCDVPAVAAQTGSAAKCGRVDGPLYHVDVRSMYPWLLRERDYPVRLIGCYGPCSPSELMGIASCRGVIARVTIETEIPEYPERHAGRIYYRTGRFTTTLTGPELLRLKADGAKVVKCHQAAKYVLGNPFRAAAAALIEMRETARGTAPAWELFAKLMGAGLGGKLAQRAGAWVPRPGVSAVQRYGEWYDCASDGKRQTRYRGIAGITWEWKPDDSGYGPYTAAFAYLTAYGRLHLRSLRDRCPERSVVSVDTDGLWLLPAGLDALRASGVAFGDRAGELRHDKTAAVGRWFGPRHYWTDAGWVLSGMAVADGAAFGGAFTHQQRYTAVGARGGLPPRGTAVRTMQSTLKVEAHGVKVGKDGWATAARRR